MNWKEIYAILESKTDGKVYRAGGSLEFENLPEPEEDCLGYVYNVINAFTTTADFVEGAGIVYPAGTNVLIADVGTESEPIYKYDVLSGLYEVDDQMSNVSENPVQNKVVKAAIEEAAAGEEITTTSTASPISTANGKPRKLTIYGKSEIVDGVIKSAGDSGNIEIETCQKNLLDPTKLVTENITYTNGTLSGTAGAFYTAYYTGIPILFNKTRQLTFSIKAYTSGSYNIGRGLLVSFVYKDNTEDTLEIFNNTTQPRVFTLTSNANKEIQYIGMAYGSEATNIWHLSEIQLEYGSTATAYEPYNGTMAVFETGTPLYGISDTARNIMNWDGSAGVVTKKCAKGRLADLSWISGRTGGFAAPISNSKIGQLALICARYPYNSSINFGWGFFDEYPDKMIYRNDNNITLYIKDTDYTTVEDFVASLGDTELVYELATPTTTPLTQTENESIAGLKTYAPQTAVTINDASDYSIEAYANTANGQVVSDMQPKISPLLTLTASGWTNNAQTVTYAHDTAKRNTIDVEPASIKAWTAAGILATAETATSITFECDTVPTADLSFRVTSMEVR